MTDWADEKMKKKKAIKKQQKKQKRAKKTSHTSVALRAIQYSYHVNPVIKS